MNQLIVYGSQYGTTQRYAERFSQLTRLPCISSEEVTDLSPYDLSLIHIYEENRDVFREDWGLQPDRVLSPMKMPAQEVLFQALSLIHI